MFFWNKDQRFYHITSPLNIFQEIGVSLESKNVISHEIFTFIDRTTCMYLFCLNNQKENRICKIFSHVTEPILKITRIDFSKSVNDLYEIDYYREIKEPYDLMPGLCEIGRFKYQVALNSKEKSYQIKTPNEFNFVAEGWWDHINDNYTYYGVYSDDVQKRGVEPRYFLYKRKDLTNQTMPWSKNSFSIFEESLNKFSVREMFN